MKSRFLAFVMPLAALVVIAFLWLRTTDQKRATTFEAPHDAAEELSEVPSSVFGPPILPAPDLVPKPESICDHCAENSCAPEPPAPRYPDIHRPAEAVCETEFFVNDRGEPFDIAVSCTDAAFVSTTEQAIAQMRWPTIDMYGEACRHIGRTDYPIRFPIEYRFE